ncbi:MAG: nuclear transport factor 2 family protein [Bacteroidota bacterium]
MATGIPQMNQPNAVPKQFTTEIIAVDEAGRARAQRIIELYGILASGPTLEKVKEYVRDDYIQHSPMLSDGPEGLTMFFQAVTQQFPAAIDVHRVMVVGDWAMAHVNFRNLNTADPNDLGNAGVDIYTFGPDGKLSEHWDAVQNVPTHSVNPHGMFLRVLKGA